MDLVVGQSTPTVIRQNVVVFATDDHSVQAVDSEQVAILANTPPYEERQRFAYRGERTTLVQRIGNLLYLGTEDHAFDVLDITREGSLQTRRYEEHWSPTLLTAGPGGTLLVGTDNGTIGVWDATLGVRLMSKKLHGSVDFLYVRGGDVYAQTDIGDTAHWNLGLLALDRCDALRKIWKDTPYVSEAGTIVRRGAPALHECSVR